MLVATPTDFQLHLFHEGTFFKSYELFGSHVLRKRKKVIGTRFTVWAPNASLVRVIGSFNNWNGYNHELQKINDSVWSIIIPEDLTGHLYKYEVTTEGGNVLHKADPYAFHSEIRPNTASVVCSLEGYKWSDANWRRKKKRTSTVEKPMFIYELHLGSWKKKKDGTFYSYVDLIDEVIPYVKEMGFTHIELLPIIEHPYDQSWGYQGTGYYSATSRYGAPLELMKFIDECHLANIGVILDWVPGHFCKDDHGLYMFDGTPTYEYGAKNDRENEVWGTANFDLGKKEVHSFLISNALFWMEYFHIDGFRVDAVANMLYWPNTNEKFANPFAIEFLKKLNKAVKEFDYSALMIAEDSTDWPYVTEDVAEGGLGFTYKWNMGWMNDILCYMETKPEHRKFHHNKVTFSLLYAFTEKFILPLSHDEVVHGKRSLLNKMPGDYKEKFDQLRLFYGMYMTHPGKKLLFMGSEFGQWDEWKDKEQVDWLLLDQYDTHQQMHTYVKQLVSLYKNTPSLYEKDFDDQGFEWIDVNNSEQSIFSYIRKGAKENDYLIVICNCTGQYYDNYKIGVPELATYEEVFTSDEPLFGGSGKINVGEIRSYEGEYHGKPYHMIADIAPFGFSVWKPVSRQGVK